MNKASMLLIVTLILAVVPCNDCFPMLKGDVGLLNMPLRYYVIIALLLHIAFTQSPSLIS